MGSIMWARQLCDFSVMYFINSLAGRRCYLQNMTIRPKEKIFRATKWSWYEAVHKNTIMTSFLAFTPEITIALSNSFYSTFSRCSSNWPGSINSSRMWSTICSWVKFLYIKGCWCEKTAADFGYPATAVEHQDDRELTWEFISCINSKPVLKFLFPCLLACRNMTWLYCTD